jgi:hypothetical protein
MYFCYVNCCTSKACYNDSPESYERCSQHGCWLDKTAHKQNFAATLDRCYKTFSGSRHIISKCVLSNLA